VNPTSGNVPKTSGGDKIKIINKTLQITQVQYLLEVMKKWVMQETQTMTMDREMTLV